jgi:hypothetical protein
LKGFGEEGGGSCGWPTAVVAVGLTLSRYYIYARWIVRLRCACTVSDFSIIL